MSGRVGIDWSAARRRLAEGERALAVDYGHDPGRRAAILEARAKSLASRGSAATAAASPRLRVLVCRLGEERCALPLSALAAIVAWRPPGAAVGGPAALLGTLYERGEIWSAFDLAALLGLPEAEAAAPSARLLLLRHERRRIGLRVDAIVGVRDIAIEHLSGLDEARAGIDGAAIRGVTPDALPVLRADAISNHLHGTETR